MLARRSVSHRVATWRLHHHSWNCTAWPFRFLFSVAFGFVLVNLFVFCVRFFFFLRVCKQLQARRSLRMLYNTKSVKSFGKEREREKSHARKIVLPEKRGHRVTCEVVVSVLWVVCFSLRVRFFVGDWFMRCSWSIKTWMSFSGSNVGLYILACFVLLV